MQVAEDFCNFALCSKQDKNMPIQKAILILKKMPLRLSLAASVAILLFAAIPAGAQALLAQVQRDYAETTGAIRVYLGKN